MPDVTARDYHAHIYFDPDEVERARALASTAHERFGVAVGRFHLQPVGPHPRGSCQLTVPQAVFGEFAQWIALNRQGLTIFVHPNTGDALADHTAHVIWFGASEPIDVTVLR